MEIVQNTDKILDVLDPARHLGCQEEKKKKNLLSIIC